MQLAAFLLDYDLTLEEAFNLPRIDVNETNVITVDPNVGSKTISKLNEYFELNIAQNLVFPKLYSCPSGVYRDINSSQTFGFGDKNSPIAGAVSEGLYKLSNEDTFNGVKVRA